MIYLPNIVCIFASTVEFPNNFASKSKYSKNVASTTSLNNKIKSLLTCFTLLMNRPQTDDVKSRLNVTDK